MLLRVVVEEVELDLRSSDLHRGGPRSTFVSFSNLERVLSKKISLPQRRDEIAPRTTSKATVVP